MIKIDKNGLLLCELQAQVFDRSVDIVSSSSAIFIRRFMNSKIAGRMDDFSFLSTNLQGEDIIQSVLDEYGVTNYGSERYTKEEMYWMGYIYRYFSYTYELTSVQVYKIIKPADLRKLYLPYHTLDPEQAIERILEARDISFDPERELKRQYEIFKSVRQ